MMRISGSFLALKISLDYTIYLVYAYGIEQREAAMKLSKAQELEAIGNHNILEDKVTVIDLKNGDYRVDIRDMEFTDAIKANLFLQHIAMTELPTNYAHLIG